jgi:hypothetical protein
MNHEFAQLVGVSGSRRRNRWYGPGVSACLASLRPRTAVRRQAVNWGKMLGLGATLAMVALAWTAVGFAVSHWLR